MKLIKVNSLLILLLLINSISWCQNNNVILPLRGINCNDTITYAKIPISYIKKANVKLIERKFYIELNNQKDSIINYKNQYINSQNIIINQLNEDYTKARIINDNIQKDLDKQKTKTKIFLYSSIGLLSVIILTSLIK